MTATITDTAHAAHGLVTTTYAGKVYALRVFTLGDESWLLTGEEHGGRWLRVPETLTRTRWADISRAMIWRDSERAGWSAVLARIGMEVY